MQRSGSYSFKTFVHAYIKKKRRLHFYFEYQFKHRHACVAAATSNTDKTALNSLLEATEVTSIKFHEKNSTIDQNCNFQHSLFQDSRESWPGKRINSVIFTLVIFKPKV